MPFQPFLSVSILAGPLLACHPEITIFYGFIFPDHCLLALPLSHRQTGTSGCADASLMGIRDPDRCFGPIGPDSFIHFCLLSQAPARSRDSLRGLQFPWVSSREQEKILFHLEFTIFYLGAYLTQIQARRKTRTLPSDLHLPHSPTENPPIKSFSLPWMVHLFFSGAIPLHIIAQRSHKQALWGHPEILPKMSPCSNLLVCISSQKKSYHILHETELPKNGHLWGILDTRIEEWEKCL